MRISTDDSDKPDASGFEAIYRVARLEATKILEIDVNKATYTNKVWHYKFARPGNRISDFQLISDLKGMVIERDDTTGIFRILTNQLPRKMLRKTESHV